MYRIFLVEDEPSLNQVLAAYMRKEGWEVEIFRNGQDAMNAIDRRPHLWVLDIMLPGIDGYQLIREIREDCADMPVIFISARDADLDRVLGLELGSDDYLAKPFLPRELVIRVRKLLERVYEKQSAGNGFNDGSPVSTLLPYRVDVQGRMTFDPDGNVLELTAKEFDLLLHLSLHAGRLLNREQLLASLWGEDYFGSDRVVDDLVRRLRKKLPELRLETVYGYGYRLMKA